MEAPKESLEKKNIFAEKYDQIRRLDGTTNFKNTFKIPL
jgi:hypothetical protein